MPPCRVNPAARRGGWPHSTVIPARRPQGARAGIYGWAGRQAAEWAPARARSRSLGRGDDQSRRHNVRTARQGRLTCAIDRKSVVKGKSVSVRVDLGGGRIIKKKTKKKITRENKKK